MGALRLMRLRICLIRGSVLVSFSLKSPTFMVCSWFLLASSKSVTTLTTPLTKQDDGNHKFLPCRSARGRVFLFAFLGQPHRGSFDLEEFSRLDLAVTHKIPVATALILQINLLKSTKILKVIESTKNGTPLLSSHEIFHWSHESAFPHAQE